MKTYYKISSAFFLVAALMFAGCKKNDDVMSLTPPTVTPPNPINNIPAPSPDVLKDSSLAIARNIYLWNNEIPATFNARSFADLNKVMEGIRPYSIEAGFSAPVDRWSFAMKKTEWDQYSGGIGNSFSSGTSADGDFGLTVFFRVEGDLRVRMVEPFSPAGYAGIQRGWRVKSINGNSNMTTSNADFIVTNFYKVSNSTITFITPDGSEITKNLQVAPYNKKPVYLDTVYTIGNKKIGYLVFNSFLGNQAAIQSEFARVFNSFSAQGVNELIVDLRYNGGGYVDLQTRLANYLVRSSANGQVMMKQIYNAQNSGNNQTTLFQKTGNLQLNDIYFLVGRGTASASELLINNLKPFTNVKLVGGATHGKPVGYFAIPVGEWYVFPVSFRTTNNVNQGNYFNGFAVNAQVADGLDKNWGDISENMLASAINNITNGSFLRAPAYEEPTSVAVGNGKLEAPLLKITIDR